MPKTKRSKAAVKREREKREKKTLNTYTISFPGRCPQPSSWTQDVLDVTECKEEVVTEQQERSSSLVQDEPEPAQIKEESLHYSLDLPECKEEVVIEQQERSSSLVKEEPEPPHIKEESLHCFLGLPLCIEEERNPRLVQEEPEPPQHIEEEQEELLPRAAKADGSTLAVRSEYDAVIFVNDLSTLPLPAVQSEYDAEYIETDWSTLPFPAVESEDGDESRETEPLASTSTENMKTLACVSRWGASPLTSDAQLLSSHCSESDNCDEREETERESMDHAFSLRLSPSPPAHIGEKLINFNQREDLNTSGVLDCKVCGRIYKHKGHLKKHMATHTLVHSCVICEKVFGQKSELKVHMGTHLEDIPFVCTVCGIGFIASSRQFIEAHQDTHSQDKDL